MPDVYARAWLSSWDRTRDWNGRCEQRYLEHCKGEIVHDTWSTYIAFKGKQTRAHCADICGDKIQYAQGSNGNPCTGASYIRHINPSENLRGDAKGALGCRFDNLNGNKLKQLSGDSKLTNSKMTDVNGQNKSVYEQLLFGARIGQYNNEGKGFCEDVNNLETVVDNNGDTCYKKIVTKLGDAVAKQEAIEYCEGNPTDPKCACINVSGSNFINHCKANPGLPGCREVVANIQAYEALGLQSATGLFGNADCIVPQICTGGVYEPQTGIPACQNKLAICKQVIGLSAGYIDQAANLNIFQGCDIQFDEARAAANQPTPSGTTPTPSGTTPTGTTPTGTTPTGTTPPGTTPPATLYEQLLQQYGLSDETGKAVGFGSIGSIISSFCIIALVVIMMSSNSNSNSGPVRTRFRY